ncbi:MAG: response regulator [Candidatus Pacebacteria bacterium]|nr:response regulator [Candidatus Paceibacterota bacterium]
MDNKKKILVVEDEATLQKALNDVLVQEGYNVLSALDGMLGLDLALKEKPDLILLDVILPKMDGFEVLKKLRENDSQIPIIILTNLSDISDIQKALDLGATTYLVKADFHLDDVLKKIKETLSKN